jgi:hypothetical protein
MLRRLSFLFPDTEYAQRAVDERAVRGVPERRIHAIAQDVDLGALPLATGRQIRDVGFRLEWFIRNTSLALFMLALIVFIASLVTGSVLWAALSLFVILPTFIAGEQFAVKVPNVHLAEFTDALAHVPVYRVAEIEGFVHHHHPESAIGGVSWTIDTLGI